MEELLRLRFMYVLMAISLLYSAQISTPLEAASAEATTTSNAVIGEVTAVTLYSTEARVERTLAIAPGAEGLRQIVIGPLSSNIFDSSIQVEGGENLISVSVQVQRSSGEPVESDRVIEQRAQLKELQQALQRLQREDQSLEKMRDRFASILPQRPDGDDEPSKIDLSAWQGLLDMVQQGMERAAKSRTALIPQLRDLESKVKQAQNRLDQMVGTSERAQSEIHIGLQDLTGAGGIVRVSYLIPGASWYPHYEVDVDTAGGVMQLRSFAVVRQMTGEDWPEIPVKFSTSAPEQGADIPELSAIRLERSRYQEITTANLRTPPAAQAVDAFFGTTTIEKRLSRLGDEGRDGLGLLHYWYGEEPISTLLPVQSNRGFLRIYSSVKTEQIPSDGEAHRLLYSIQQLEINEERICVPELNTAVFRRVTALLEGLDPLLQGTVAVFLGEDYLGQTIIDTTAPGEELTLDLGVDDQVRVKRVQRDSEDQVGIFSKSVHYRTDLALTIDNFQNKPITLFIKDRIPFTESDLLKVKIDRATTTHMPEGFDSDDGLLSWTLEVASGETTNLELGWWIEAPPDVQLTRREAPERLGKGE